MLADVWLARADCGVVEVGGMYYRLCVQRSHPARPDRDFLPTIAGADIPAGLIAALRRRRRRPWDLTVAVADHVVFRGPVAVVSVRARKSEPRATIHFRAVALPTFEVNTYRPLGQVSDTARCSR